MNIEKIKQLTEEMDVIEGLYGRGVITLAECQQFTGKGSNPVPPESLKGQIREEMDL